ncbi:kunitz-type U19-barytoxin-Tl1a-like [Hyposmocoma kahamanoa]|uniref:kunitz-type U19-barytoxin-Tl1a-like n=1 Tax=Hyposmocoma kahamanoa TaxID=1477025 RepID=UPI000E6D7943|nr:kunitz-type U19-barytoxin-Tl1a-like [Hyposmocoma kahamanoa]
MTPAVLIILVIYFINLCTSWLHLNTISSIYVKRVVTESSILKKTCLLIPETGPCRAGIRMYYFDPAKKNCSQFLWGGCQGNGNRYKTLQECTDTCLSKENWKAGRPRWCHLSFDYGFCFGGIRRYYYDRLYKVCKETVYSGCGGNKNNFYSLEQCNQVCTLGNKPLSGNATKKRTGLKKVLIINPSSTITKKTPATGKSSWIETDTTPKIDTTQKIETTPKIGTTKPTDKGTPVPGPRPTKKHHKAH